MHPEPDIAVAAALIGDPARAAMLSALLDRTPLSAGQLAFAANVSPQSASFHLAKLTSAELLIGERKGRSQVYRLAGPTIANAIEALSAMSPTRPGGRCENDRFRSARMQQLRAARTCYDHLAGVAGVLLHDSLLKLGYLIPDGPKQYTLTASGHDWVSAIGGAPEIRRKQSPFARQCVDWSERRPHLAGRLAAHMLDFFLKDRWIAQIRDTRAVRITERGLREFERQYGLNLKAS